MALHGMGLIEMMMLMLAPMGGGNDLLDFLTVQQYWKAQGVEISVEAMTAELREVEPAGDISPLIEQLGDAKFTVREAATRKIRALGPAAVEQLRLAAKSTDAEIATRAQALLKVLDRSGKKTLASRLMAIRTLGELKNPAALPLLRKQLSSDEAFLAEYAARAVALIEGKPYSRPRLSTRQLDEDLALLPAECGMVGQLSLRLDTPYRLDDALKQPGFQLFAPGILGGGQNAEERQKRLQAQLLTLIGMTGNLRVDSVTMGLSEKIGPKDGFVVFVFRGRYNREALAETFKKFPTGMTTRKVGDVTVIGSDREAEFVLLSDRRLMFVAGPKQRPLTIEALLASGEKSIPRIHSNATMKKLIAGVDRSSAIWGVVNVTEGYRADLDGPFATFQSAVLTMKQSKQALQGTFVAQGADGGKVKQAVDVMEEGRKKMIAEAKPALAAMPMFKPILDAFESVRVETSGTTATVTWKLDNYQDVLGMPMIAPLMIGRGMAAKPPPQAIKVQPQPVEKKPVEKKTLNKRKTEKRRAG